MVCKSRLQHRLFFSCTVTLPSHVLKLIFCWFAFFHLFIRLQKKDMTMVLNFAHKKKKNVQIPPPKARYAVMGKVLHFLSCAFQLTQKPQTTVLRFIRRKNYPISRYIMTSTSGLLSWICQVTRKKELGSDQRISVHVNTPSDRIQWNVKWSCWTEILAWTWQHISGDLGMIAWCLPPYYLVCKREDRR